MTVLHLNISSVSFHINELKLLLSSFNLNFDIILCITENRITMSNLPTSHILFPVTTINKHPQNLLQVVHWFIYLKNVLPKTSLTSKHITLNKNKPDLQTYHPKHLESTFIEILLPDKSKLIIGTVYKHPPMKPYSFNTSFSQLLQKIKRENKKTGDFNLNLLN